MTAEPIGPALAAELGGEWDAYNQCVVLGDTWVRCTALGSVLVVKRIGSSSDGVEALAAEARRLGVA